MLSGKFFALPHPALAKDVRLETSPRRAKIASPDLGRIKEPALTPMKQFVGLLVSLAVAFSAAAIGAIASVHAAEFYQQLVRPNWAPSPKLFGPVWSILYFLMAISSWLVWRERGSGAKGPLLLYFVQLGLNALWSWLFFAWHQGQWAFVEIILLWLLISVTLVSFWRVRPLAGALMLPYLLWVSFASVLAFKVWSLNPTLLR